MVYDDGGYSLVSNSKKDVYFNKVHSFRSSVEIDGMISYWVNNAVDECGDRLFSSEGHFLRSAIVRFDSFLRSRQFK